MTAPETNSTAHWIAMRHLHRLMGFAQSSGHDRAALLDKVGLRPHQLMDADMRVPADVFETLFGMLEADGEAPFIGLDMAEDIPPSALGAMGFLLQSCGTLAELVDVTGRFRGLMSSIGHASVVHGPGRFELRWDCLADMPLLRRHATEYVIGSYWMIGRFLVPDLDPPIAVQFAHAAPADPGHVRRHLAFFGCPVYFDRPHSSLVMPASSLHKPLPHGDAVLKDLLARHTRQLLETQSCPPSLIDEVRRLLKALVLAGHPARETVARQLGISARSLHRKLEDAGTSYRDQLDGVRLEMARLELADGVVPIVELADQLGFGSAQAFTRWFKERCGVAPGQYRAAAAGWP